MATDEKIIVDEMLDEKRTINELLSMADRLFDSDGFIRARRVTREPKKHRGRPENPIREAEIKMCCSCTKAKCYGTAACVAKHLKMKKEAESIG